MAMMELNLLLMKETDNEKMHFWPISRPSPEKPSSQILQLKENWPKFLNFSLNLWEGKYINGFAENDKRAEAFRRRKS